MNRKAGLAAAFAVLLLAQTAVAGSAVADYQGIAQRAAQGDPAAEYEMGLMHFSRMTAADNTKALDWLNKSAEHGYAEAQYILGSMYASGKNVPKDEAQAFKWYGKAARQGLDKAQYNLAVLFTQGLGVTQNDGMAFIWAQKAAIQGMPDA